ncbi:MAG: PQQ-binding-like beta-propeller repeat protein [Gammaproteobacteria bacterium]
MTGRKFILLAGLLLAALSAQAQEAWSPKALTQLPTTAWRTNGGNLYNQRYSPLADIKRDNIAQLKAEWVVHLGSGVAPKNSGEAQPLVADGVAYIASGDNDVFAVELATGKILWSYYARLDQGITTVCCGWTSRGVGLNDDSVFVGQLDGKLLALNRKDGSVRWQIQAEQWQQGFTITAAPLYYDGMVITGFAGGEMGVRGRVKAFNATDGVLKWTFYTIPAPGEFGHDTWSADNQIWQHGGATVWQTPAVDPELGLLYFSTGNAGPDYNGNVRHGDNLFTASIIALDVKTGTYRWHFQEVHHDIWDYDASNPVILFNIDKDGVPRKGIAQAGKTGWVYILDRTTGEPLVGIDERTVPQRPENGTAATQPYPVGDAFVPHEIQMAPEGYPMINKGRIFTPYWTDPVVVAPGLAGGANWPPSAVDPLSGIMYICGNDRPFAYKANDIGPEQPQPGANYTGGDFLGYPLWNMGVFAAMDLHTNKLVWQRHWKDPCNSGVTVTASGLVFVGRNDGRLVALDNKDGNVLWEFQTGAGMNAPVTIFENNGVQYVLAYAAGNSLGPSPHGDSLWLFSLNGKLEQALPAGAAQAAAASKQPAAGKADLKAGQLAYNSVCANCHGEEGRGGHGGGISLENAKAPEFVLSLVNQGRNRMPALGVALTPEQLRDVAAYVAQKLAK